MSEQQLLAGTPYSLPSEANASLGEMRQRLADARAGLRTALQQAQSMGLVREMDRAHSYWSVFESNSIEFEGPDLAGTVDAIESPTGQDVLRDLNVNLLPEVLKRDRRAFAAIGLETARVLALRYVGNGERGMTQSDLRSLHAVVMSGQWYAGQYRQFDAGITDSDHRPFPTYEIRRSMQELADWSRGEIDPDLAALRAAVGHAWFTHVHPFQDGNGRVGRLVTNVLLGQDGLPPAIVKAQSQRSQYIAALAHSDEAGDIMPLTGLFLKTVERYVGELQRPKTFQKLFRRLVARRGDSYYDWYSTCLSDFLTRLTVELNVHGLEFTLLDSLTSEVFDDIRRPDYSQLTTDQHVVVGVVTNVYGRELAVYLRRPSTSALNLATKAELVPGTAFAVPNPRYNIDAYRRTRVSELDGLVGMWVQPERPIDCYVEGQWGVQRMGVADAAVKVARHISRGYKVGFDDSGERFGTARWTSRIHGGPG